MKRSFAKKSFGQNFLVDKNYILKIISALAPRKGETIIEIGAGRGALTELLIESGANVIAIELDRDLIPLLTEQFSANSNFELVSNDALEVDFTELLTARSPNSTAKLVANLPYNISTAILQKLIEHREVFSEMILMFQREVVDRITAAPGQKDRGYLTLVVEGFLDAQKLFDVPPSAFRPVPKVWSSIVRLTKNEFSDDEPFDKLFRDLISVGFLQKRKTIKNNLKNLNPDLSRRFENRGGLSNILKHTGIAENRRAEALSLEEWRKLTNHLLD